MNARYSPSFLARAIAGVSLAASIIGSAGPASAVTCTLGFPITNAVCQQGSSRAVVTHFLGGNPVKFRLSVDFQGGTLMATAQGIDINGNKQSGCARTAADDSPFVGGQSSVDCQNLFGVPGTVFSSIAIDHPFNMRSTFVIAI
jgi:hypothetical protein